ncbi:MAG: outer membrane lipoprotein carrier protein LolA [SAR86 cluster bacterium]|uniref:Outer-membrane lipoprotein carrier protein n=1 Tax=SAR86 cluster bacterium TaxID=2030880 RepID=A0A2A5B4U5_9GAMM|nr:MAG: outer membrane lipoprotein carrier protein LolA [SAR86 cluster bacterium]
MNKLIKKLTTASVFAIAFLWMNSTVAQTDAIQRLDVLLQGIQTLKADVVQLIVESNGGILEESEIKMYLKKPDGFYWETLTPFPELVVTNGTTLWNYVPDLEQVVIEDWNSSRSQLAAQLLNGQTDNLSEEYTIEIMNSVGSEYQEFELAPISVDSVYRSISINFMHAELDSIYLDNKNGQKTVWRFENIERNSTISDNQFEFQIPDGIEVVENSYSQ